MEMRLHIGNEEKGERARRDFRGRVVPEGPLQNRRFKWGRSAQQVDGTHRTFVPFSKGCVQLVSREK